MSLVQYAVGVAAPFAPGMAADAIGKHFYPKMDELQRIKIIILPCIIGPGTLFSCALPESYKIMKIGALCTTLFCSVVFGYVASGKKPKIKATTLILPLAAAGTALALGSKYCHPNVGNGAGVATAMALGTILVKRKEEN